MLELVANAPSPHAGHFRMARLLLSRGADINLCHPQICGLVPLHFAVKRMIAGPPDNPHLAESPDEKKLAMVKFLLSNGADVMPRTVNGTGHTGPSEFCATSI